MGVGRRRTAAGAAGVGSMMVGEGEILRRTVKKVRRGESSLLLLLLLQVTLVIIRPAAMQSLLLLVVEVELGSVRALAC